eukprot:SAG31_NODE_8434_length_1452_cov_8.988395_2_plen_24_part_01
MLQVVSRIGKALIFTKLHDRGMLE